MEKLSHPLNLAIFRENALIAFDYRKIPLRRLTLPQNAKCVGLLPLFDVKVAENIFVVNTPKNIAHCSKGEILPYSVMRVEKTMIQGNVLKGSVI